MESAKIELLGVRYENVRGFYDATLPLQRDKILLVGRNHAGKTSAFLLLNWLINDADSDRLFRHDYLTQKEQELLLPARDARHRARRISLRIRFADGRKARKFKAEDDCTILRIGFRVTGTPYGFIQLGPATRDSGDQSSRKAAELLTFLQDTYSVLHIPSARDAKSEQFRNRLKTLFKDKLSERALHPGRPAGAPAEYRQVAQSTGDLKQIAEKLLNPLLNDLAKSLPSGMLDNPSLSFGEQSEQSIVDWMVDRITLKLVTGEHDNMGVTPSEVGAGLQSVLEIAAASVILNQKEKALIVAVEEPEAFLHPSIQRTVARKLLSGEYGDKTLVSTHSPILVEEAGYDNILLMVDRTIQQPAPQNDLRSSINSALLTGQGAEMIFAASILLVEGDGDRAFFEGLRRRLAPRDTSGRIDNLFVVPVGGKTSFGPWINLLRSLNSGGNLQEPKYLVAADGDAISDIHKAFTNNKISVPRDALKILQDSSSRWGEGKLTDWIDGINHFNNIISEKDQAFPLRFLEGDLEYAIFRQISEKDCKTFAGKYHLTFHDKCQFIKSMGSKAVDGKANNSNKAPYLRKHAAQWIPMNSLSKSVRHIVTAWLINAGFGDKEVSNLLREN